MSGIFVLIAIAWVVYAAIAKKANAQQQAQRQVQACLHLVHIRGHAGDDGRGAHGRQRKLNENVAEAEAETSSLHAKTQAAAPRVAPTVGVSQNGAWTCGCGYRNTANSKFCRQCGAARAQSGSMNYASSEGRSTEGGGGLKRPPLARETMPKPSLNHVVKPMTESHHSHTEASISGREAKCEERYTEAEDAYSGAEQRAAYAVDIGDREKIIQGILYSEILSKPKALRK